MTAAADKTDSSLHRFATDDFPERDRVTQWRELCGRKIMKVDMEPLPQQPFRCVAELRSLPNLGIAAITTTPNRLTRSRAQIADGNGDFILVMPTHGEATIAQRNQEVRLAQDTGWLIRSDEPSLTVVRSMSRFVSLAIPAAVLNSLIVGLDATVTPAIAGNPDAVRLLVGYLGCLRDEAALSAPDLRQSIVTHIHDLVALAVGATRDAAEVAQGRGLGAARLRAIKAEVNANLDRQELSAETVALSQGITPRYVRKLFESEGMSFSDFVRSRRLARAHDMLADRRYLGRTISAIAYDCGFSDVSYFNRTFRRLYGMTPSDVREAVRRGG
ncbi:AraC family transcriptional regulator [Bradyrhizobium sp.]|uniref:AraC family transcriptional regulator n=1 Tax=Bradyrhizobium sp. TaxID=376 RepID=UPI0040377FB6